MPYNHTGRYLVEIVKVGNPTPILKEEVSWQNVDSPPSIQHLVEAAARQQKDAVKTRIINLEKQIYHLKKLHKLYE